MNVFNIQLNEKTYKAGSQVSGILKILGGGIFNKFFMLKIF